jgi:regulator of protease activity HflC (stomatin/prohibitin superfamily)
MKKFSTEEMKVYVTKILKSIRGDKMNPKYNYDFNRYDFLRIIVLIAIITIYNSVETIVQYTFIGMTILIVMVFSAPFVPFVAKLLSNQPNKFRPLPGTSTETGAVARLRRLANVEPYKADTLAFFTFLDPGYIKAIIRGEGEGRFIRFLMRYNERSFKGNTSEGVVDWTKEEKEEAEKNGQELKKCDRLPIKRNSRNYWEVITTPSGDNDSHPIPYNIRVGLFDLTWWWSRAIYKISGAIFTGIPPYQTVKTYKLDQFKKAINDEAGREGEFVFVRWFDYSDQLRASEFQFFVEIPSADTIDLVKVKTQFAVTVQVENPYRTYYDAGTDWASRLFTAIVQEVSAEIRGLSYKEVIGAGALDIKTSKNLLCVPILKLNEKGTGDLRSAKFSIAEIGLFIKEAELINADVTDTKLADKLADVAVAKADKEATIIRSEGDAQGVLNISEAVKKYGTIGELALNRTTQIKTTEAASKNGGRVFLTIGSEKAAIDTSTALLEQAIEGEGKDITNSKDTSTKGGKD